MAVKKKVHLFGRNFICLFIFNGARGGAVC
jgi:hypothetical protein